MASFSNMFTNLTGVGFFYEKSSRHASHVFNQEGLSLYRNQPRMPFEYYVNITLNNVDTAKAYIATYFNNNDFKQIAPLVKSIEMPSMKIDTVALNQYNRKRLSQNTMSFEPIKMVFHDVADGKTLKFWDMYYRYYFGDGNEPGKNKAELPAARNKPGLKGLVESLTPKINPDILSLPSSIKGLLKGKSKKSPLLPGGEKSTADNILADKLNNHHFGFNLPDVQNVRNLIQTIDIYQVHAGRFNKVTLVNPRICAFTHDVLSYSTTDKTLELTFTIDYEYAYYTIQNKKLGEDGSTKDQFSHGEFLELPALAFNTALLDFIESNNPLLGSDNPILNRIGKNVQSSVGKVTGSFLSDKVVRKTSASVLNGMAKISPTPYAPAPAPAIVARSFAAAPAATSAAKYPDMNRIGKK